MEEFLEGYRDEVCLITGGAGCIGSNLIRGLLPASPKRIIVLDDLSATQQWNLPEDDRVTFIMGSVLDEEALRQAFSARPSRVFHLAAHFANQNSIEHPETDLTINGLGTLKVLRYSELAKVARVVFASSGCSVYGSQAPLPLREEFVSLHLDTPYQITKLLGELYCNLYHDYYELPVVIARYFNVYGPGEIPGRYRNVIPNFAWWALHKMSLPVTGSGDETRDFTYVSDIVDGTLRLGTMQGVVGEAFNLASGTETRVLDVAEKVNALAQNDAGLKFVPKRDWDKIERRRASIDKARKVIGYEPKVAINEGIAETVKWVRRNLQRIESSTTL